MENFVPQHESTKEWLYLKLKKVSITVENMQNTIFLLNERLQYLESTFLPIPEEHEILYEKVYQVNPLYPPGQDRVTFDKSPASNALGETS